MAFWQASSGATLHPAPSITLGCNVTSSAGMLSTSCPSLVRPRFLVRSRCRPHSPALPRPQHLLACAWQVSVAVLILARFAAGPEQPLALLFSVAG
jgi:hypothetical protein